MVRQNKHPVLLDRRSSKMGLHEKGPAASVQILDVLLG